MKVKLISLGFELLFGQNKKFEGVTADSSINRQAYIMKVAPVFDRFIDNENNHYWHGSKNNAWLCLNR